MSVTEYFYPSGTTPDTWLGSPHAEDDIYKCAIFAGQRSTVASGRSTMVNVILCTALGRSSKQHAELAATRSAWLEPVATWVWQRLRQPNLDGFIFLKEVEVGRGPTFGIWIKFSQVNGYLYAIEEKEIDHGKWGTLDVPLGAFNFGYDTDDTYRLIEGILSS